MYDRSSQAMDIDAVRLDMFAKKQRLHDTKPLTLIKLVQNTKKICIPSSLHLESIETCQIYIESPTSEWDWQHQDSSW